MKRHPVEVAARFTYIIRHWDPDDWPVEPIGNAAQNELPFNNQ